MKISFLWSTRKGPTPHAPFGRVRILGPSRVTATVCSKWADRLPSLVMLPTLGAAAFSAGHAWFLRRDA